MMQLSKAQLEDLKPTSKVVWKAVRTTSMVKLRENWAKIRCWMVRVFKNCR